MRAETLKIGAVVEGGYVPLDGTITLDEGDGVADVVALLDGGVSAVADPCLSNTCRPMWQVFVGLSGGRQIMLSAGFPLDSIVNDLRRYYGL